MARTNQERARTALQRIARLNAEQHAIYRAASRSFRLSGQARQRLTQINREIALAQDERNRARCGAPPAPPDYDPVKDPTTFDDDEAVAFGRERGGNRKTNEDEVREMRRLYVVEQLSAMAIWREFPHLKESTVRDILKNRTWYDPSYQPPHLEESESLCLVAKEQGTMYQHS